MAKTVNFGVIYGMSAHGLAAAAGHPARGGGPVHRRLFRPLSEGAGVSGQAAGELPPQRLRRARSWAGARAITRHPRRFDVSAAQPARARSDQHGDPGLGRRPDQAGDAATCTAACGASELPARMLLQIHDELVFEVPPEELDGRGRLVREEMTDALGAGAAAGGAAEGGSGGRAELAGRGSRWQVVRW